MDFLWITINVNNLDESIKFYEDIAGLKTKSMVSPSEGIEIAFMEDEKSSTQVELFYNSKAGNVTPGSDYSIGFETENLEETLKLTKENGVNVVSDIIQPTPRIKFFYALDPDGRRIQFVERLND